MATVGGTCMREPVGVSPHNLLTQPRINILTCLESVGKRQGWEKVPLTTRCLDEDKFDETTRLLAKKVANWQRSYDVKARTLSK
jgi:hypothetical protein